MRMKRYGTWYGGFWYPDTLPGLNKDSVIYCVGAGEDITHDICLAKQLGSKVYIFDPTPRAIDHVRLVKDVLKGDIVPQNSSRYGGGDPNYWNIILSNKINPENIVFCDHALNISPGRHRFFKPNNENFVSHSLVEGMKGDNYIMVEAKTLKQIMEDFGHDKIDLLKIDIEGSELDVIEYMIKEKIFPQYLSVDFDSFRDKKDEETQGRCVSILKKLSSEGYRTIHEENKDYTFQRILSSPNG